jgi:uncharacterized integral membrane protein
MTMDPQPTSTQDAEDAEDAPTPERPINGTEVTEPRQAPPPYHRIKRTWIGGLWVSLAAGGIVLLLLLIFILENSKTVDIAYFGFHGHLPLGVALLLAAVCGVLLVILAGTARISQLRAAARRHRRADARRLKAEAKEQG